jgi:hypothetical protein
VAKPAMNHAPHIERPPRGCRLAGKLESKTTAAPSAASRLNGEILQQSARPSPCEVPPMRAQNAQGINLQPVRNR